MAGTPATQGLSAFFAWEKASRDSLDVKKIYIDMAGDILTGILLSQIVYWHLPNKQGQSKLRVLKCGHAWLVKKRDDWWEECRLTPRQVDRAIKSLAEQHLIVTSVRKFNGAPTLHVRIDEEGFLARLDSFACLPEITKREAISPTGDILDITQRGEPLTETTTETKGLPESEDSGISTASGKPPKRQPGECSWCLDPFDPWEDESKPEVTRLMQFYHDEYRRIHRNCPTWLLTGAKGGQEWAAMKELLVRVGDYMETAVILTEGVECKLEYYRQKGHKPSLILHDLDGFIQAHARGERFGGRPARRSGG